MINRKDTRREFLRQTGRLAAGAVFAGSFARNALAADMEGVDPSTIVNHNPNMRYRRLGKTDLWLSEISLGGHWRNRDGGRYWDGNFGDERVPEDVVANRGEVMDECIAAGINYLDITTAAECLAYGAALKGRREAMVVGADNHLLGPRNPENRTVERHVYNVEECLRQLGMEYMDIWRVQAHMFGDHTDDEVRVMIEAAQLLREQGKIRHFGMSCHNRNFLLHVIETFPEVEMVIFPYTANSRSAESDPGHGADQSQSIFPALERQDVGAVCIKPFGGGSLFRRQDVKFGEEVEGNAEDHELAQLTLAYIVCNPYITATVPGMTTPLEVRNNAVASERAQSLMKDEANRGIVADAGERMMANLPDDYAWLRDWKFV